MSNIHILLDAMQCKRIVYWERLPKKIKTNFKENIECLLSNVSRYLKRFFKVRVQTIIPLHNPPQAIGRSFTINNIFRIQILRIRR